MVQFRDSDYSRESQKGMERCKHEDAAGVAQDGIPAHLRQVLGQLWLSLRPSLRAREGTSCGDNEK